MDWLLLCRQEREEVLEELSLPQQIQVASRKVLSQVDDVFLELCNLFIQGGGNPIFDFFPCNTALLGDGFLKKTTPMYNL